jgi:hypothetical protein
MMLEQLELQTSALQVNDRKTGHNQHIQEDVRLQKHHKKGTQAAHLRWIMAQDTPTSGLINTRLKQVVMEQAA